MSPTRFQGFVEGLIEMQGSGDRRIGDGGQQDDDANAGKDYFALCLF
jgi:hypothetical protein